MGWTSSQVVVEIGNNCVGLILVLMFGGESSVDLYCWSFWYLFRNNDQLLNKTWWSLFVLWLSPAKKFGRLSDFWSSNLSVSLLIICIFIVLIGLSRCCDLHKTHGYCSEWPLPVERLVPLDPPRIVLPINMIDRR